jgi:hypothetical protein
LVVSLLYLLFRRGLAVAALRLRSREFKELEIVVLRHELAVLRLWGSLIRFRLQIRVFSSADRVHAPHKPQPGFSRASRTISARRSAPVAGLPGGRCGNVQRRASSDRCQRRIVSGRTNRLPHRSRGSIRANAARKHPISWTATRPDHLPAKHRKLVTQDQQLDLVHGV